MRVVGGKYRNRRLHPPKEMEARPTTDFAKEGLFNVLQHSEVLDGIRVLDLFAGTGNISLEFLSRGASEVLSVEQDRRLVDFMVRTAKELGEGGWRAVKADVSSFLRTHCAFAKPSAEQGRGRYDIVFADPPFHMEGIEAIPTLVSEAGLLGSEGLLIMEHHAKVDLSGVPGYQHTRSYGLIRFSFFRPNPTP